MTSSPSQPTIPPAAAAVPRPQRRVRFSELSSMFLIQRLSDCYPTAKSDLWFSPDEVDQFKANLPCHIRLVRYHVAKEYELSASDILGLEKFLTLRLTEEYKSRRSELSNEVLKECRGQQQQRRRSSVSSGTAATSQDDAVKILARVSARNSQWARERARASALFLEQEQEDERRLSEEGKADERRRSSDGQLDDCAAPSSLRQCLRRSSLQESKRSRTVSPTEQTFGSGY